MPLRHPENPKPLCYVEMPPSADLRALVATYWSFTVRTLPHSGFTHRVWPDGCAGLVIGRIPGRGSVALVVGASTRAAEVPLFAGAQYWGIRFRPDAGSTCCDQDAVAMRNTTLDAQDCFGDRLAALVTTLLALPDAADATRSAATLDCWALHLLPRTTQIDSLVTAAVDLIVAADGTTSIAAVAGQLNVSPRHLQRRFRLATGLTPKEYASIRRGRAALKRLALTSTDAGPVTLSQLAADSGYADQSHLTRECARLTTFTPATLAERLGTITHERLVD